MATLQGSGRIHAVQGWFRHVRFPLFIPLGPLPHACKAMIGWIILVACAPVPAEMLPATAVVAVASLPVLRRWIGRAPRLLPALAMLVLGVLSLRLAASGGAMTTAALMLLALPAVLTNLLGERRAGVPAQAPPGLAGEQDDIRPHNDEACQDGAHAPAAQAAGADTQADRASLLVTISHDLRQPIHAIGLLVAAIKEHPQTPAAAHLIERLDRSMCGLDEFFGRLLEFGRLRTGTVTPEVRAFKIEPLLQTLQERFAQMAAQRGLQLWYRSSPELAVESDPALVVEILMNLLSNAMRCTEHGGVLLTARRRGARVALQVWDTGIGIEGAQLDRIFDEFVQLGTPARGRRQGLGLGLAIVRHLARELGTSVVVRSRPGRGSTFTFLLPAISSPAAPEIVNDDRPDALRGLLVLVVDDDANTLIATEAALSAWGCLVLLARDERSALAAVKRSERFPDVLITEYWIDEQPSGLQVAEAVRSAMPFELPVLVATSKTDEVIKRRAADSGSILLDKPIDPNHLREVLVKTCQGEIFP